MRFGNQIRVALVTALVVASMGWGPVGAGAKTASAAFGGAVTADATAKATAPATAETTVAVVPTITVAAVGDMCFASSVGSYVASHGPHAPFSAVRSLLTGADVTVGNLECALSRRGSRVPGKAFTFEGPPRATQGLTWAGFDIVALANNHARDYGAAALLDTVSNLDSAGIGHAGAGKNRSAAWRPAMIERNGATIAYLSFCQIGPSDFAAGRSRAGTAYTLNLTQVKQAIRSARKQADYVIVAFHWGIEGSHGVTARQVRFGRAAIDNGADLVLSHHPHVIEGVELYKHKLIAYSLGNFVFSPGSAAGHDTMVLSVTVTPKGVVTASARPVYIGANGRPSPAKGSTARRILGIIGKATRGRKTKTHVSKGTIYFSR